MISNSIFISGGSDAGGDVVATIINDKATSSGDTTGDVVAALMLFIYRCGALVLLPLWCGVDVTLRRYDEVLLLTLHRGGSSTFAARWFFHYCGDTVI